MTPNAKTLTIDLGGGERVDMLYRPDTKDRFTLEENWARHPYRLSRHGGIARRLFIDETYERLLAEGRTPLILDLGANIGASARVLARYYPAAEILALEPEPGNFELLEANTRGVERIRCLAAAVAAQDGQVRLADPGRSTDAYRTGAAAEGDDLGTVRALSVASLLAMSDATPFLAKIDIEGAEAELFAGDTDWVDRFPAIAIELHDWMLPGQASSAAFLACVAARRRDFLHPPQTDIAFSLRNPA